MKSVALTCFIRSLKEICDFSWKYCSNGKRMEFNYFDVSVLTLSCLITIFLFFSISSFSRTSNFLVDYDKAFNVIDVIKALKNICPVNSSNKWQLLPIDIGSLRCWKQAFSFPILNSNINLYGSVAVVDCSSLHALSDIADLSKWSEWNPLSHKLFVKSFKEKRLRSDDFMQSCKVIGVKEETTTKSYLTFYRFMDFNEKKVGWVLYWSTEKLEFLFYLVQPIIKDGVLVESCLITHLFGTTCNQNAASSTVQRLRNLKDFISLSLLNVALLNAPLSLERTVNCPVVPTKPKVHDFNECMQAQKSELHGTMFILAPFSYSDHCTLKNLKGFKLAVKNKSANSLNVNKPVKKDNSSENSDKKAFKRNLKRSVSDYSIKVPKTLDLNKNSETINANLTKSESFKSYVNNFNEVKKQTVETLKSSALTEEKPNTLNEADAVKENALKCIQKEKLRSLSETAAPNSDDKRIFSFSDASIQEDSNESLESNMSEDNLLAVDKQVQNEVFCASFSDFDFEIVDSENEISDSQLAYFKTQGNFGAAELQAEILLASYLDQNSSGDVFKLDGGWMIHSCCKGISVLTKSTTSHFMKVTSFLCQTTVPVPCEDVWKHVKNPRFRFISDETVKTVEIIEQISTSQKIIHIYHENSGFLRKEMFDFCLLHTEREEKNRYYSSFHSVEYEKCPFMESVTRGILRPSGWVVEEVENDPSKSKVTYMIQILVCSPDSSYIQNLSTLVPQSVYNLKNYAMAKPM